MATFDQEPPGQAQSIVTIPGSSILSGGTGVYLYDPDPYIIWPAINDDASRASRTFPSFGLVSFNTGAQTAGGTINDVYLAYLTFECPPCPPCPPVPAYSLTGQRWPWGFGQSLGGAYQVEIQPPTAGAIVLAGLIPVINQATDALFSSNSLLIPFDGTVGSNAAPLDRSNNALTLTASSAFTISDTQFKYGQAGFFNGSARVVVPGTSLLSFPGDFELQMWFYMLSKSNTSYSTLLELGSYTDGLIIRHGDNPGIGINSSGFNLGTEIGGLALNAWHHVAVCRIGTTAKAYLNGQETGTATVTGTINGNVGQTFIGDSTHASSRFFNGYIDDLRIKKGVSTITGNFTPVGPHPIQGSSGDQNFANVSLLLPLNGANGSTTFTDFSPTTKTITAFGNAQMSTAQSKYGGASALFDGSGGYIQSSISDGLNLSASDFTIEFWARFLTGGEVNQVLFQLGTTGDLYSGLMQLNNGVKVFLGSDGSSWNIAENVSVGPKVENTWVHYALTRSGSTFRAFADGVQQSTWTSSASIHQSSNGITIGKGQFAFVNRNLNAHIDDFRVTKGIARYTANFTPTGPHPLS